MIRFLLVNIGLAGLWVLLMGGGLAGFLMGIVLGYLVLLVFRSVVGSSDYVRRVGAFFYFLCIFTREFLVSNMIIACAVLSRPSDKIHPNFMTYDVSGMKDWEIFLLSQCITLTPGTTSVDLVDEGETLVIHTFDADQPDEVRKSIDGTLKQAILRFSR